ncbi:hypothetical protein PO909_005965 [Leuciscus waleckii]
MPDAPLSPLSPLIAEKLEFQVDRVAQVDQGVPKISLKSIVYSICTSIVTIKTKYISHFYLIIITISST